MILEGYGVVLKRLAHEDIELVRQMRNADHIRAFMHYREIISAEQQEKWFASINNEHNNYFVIQHEGHKCGLISGTEIDWDRFETGNGGLFIWDEEYQGSMIPVAASLLLTEMSFNIGFRKSTIRVLPDNQRALQFNKLLGYTPEPGLRADGLQEFSLTPDQFDIATESLRKMLEKNRAKLKCILQEPLGPESVMVRDAILALPPERRSKFEFEILPA